MRNRMYGGVRGRKTKVGEKLLRFPPTRYKFKRHYQQVRVKVCNHLFTLNFYINLSSG